jgi:rhamnosyltransferase
MIATRSRYIRFVGSFAGTPRLVVMAHFDVDGELAPHVRRHVEAWRGVADRLIVVSTSELTPASRDWLTQRAELVERENFGYDFMSYKTGLDHAGDLKRYAEVVLCNDSFVGPLRPYAEIFDTMATRPVDFWGLTKSHRISTHIQSFFVVFRSWVVRSRAYSEFWTSMSPVSDRTTVIHRYEVGFSKQLLSAGFTLGSYFEENDVDRRLARRRMVWWAYLRGGGGLHARRNPNFSVRATEAWNPTYALADRALEDARIPFVKLDLLRHDPMGLNARSLLARCEASLPAEFAGVADFLRRTAPHYPPRLKEALPHPRFPVTLLRWWVAYR